jgi:hypothetical protein
VSGSVDLHTHTTASDGTLSPAELVAAAREAGLAAIAVTDHDTTAGIDEALAAGIRQGVEVVAGIEAAAEHTPGHLHIVGLFVDPLDPGFSAWLGRMVVGRGERNPRIVERLRAIGIDVSMEEVRAVAATPTIGRPHIAAVLVRRGFAASIQEAFDRYLDRGGPAYVDRRKPTSARAIERIHEGGGLAVLAHPHECGARDAAELETLVSRLKGEGLDGIEVFCSSASPRDEELAATLAHRFGLLESGGTDFHGAGKPQVRVGVGRGNLDVPYRFLERLREALAHRSHSPKGVCVWFTGLPGSGKSATAAALAARLRARGRTVTLLDGDEVRARLWKELGYSREDRDSNVHRAGYLASEVVKHGGVAVCAFIAPYREARDRVRAMIGGDRFVEVFVETPLAVCEARDTKGLYRRARAGEIRGFTGVDDPYEPPLSPEVRVDTSRLTVEAAAEAVLAALRAKKLLR